MSKVNDLKVASNAEKLFKLYRIPTGERVDAVLQCDKKKKNLFIFLLVRAAEN